MNIVKPLDWEKLTDAEFQEYWEKIIDLTHKIVQLQGLRLKISPADLEDITQEVVISLSRKSFEQLDKISNFKAFLTAVVRNKLSDYLRNALRKSTVSLDDLLIDRSDEEPLTLNDILRDPKSIEDSLDLEIVRELANQLPDEDKQILDFCLQGASFNEVAKQLGISKNTLRSRFRRIIIKLRKIQAFSNKSSRKRGANE